MDWLGQAFNQIPPKSQVSDGSLSSSGQLLINNVAVIPYQFIEVSHIALSDLDKILFVGSPS